MACFLFWNLFGKRLEDRVARLAVRHDIDVLMLAECVLQSSEVTNAIASAGGGRYHAHGVVEQEEHKVRVFSRLDESSLVAKYSDGRLRISKMYLAGQAEILLAMAHFPSPSHRSKGGLAQSATRWASRIKQIEQDVGHRRTVLVGDLNMNPFDEGVVGGHALHAVMTRSKASENERQVDGEPSPFFYNPMWGFFGDRTTGPPGTYYFSSTDPINYFWNMYDQVLLRPELIDRLERLEILDHDGQDSLVTVNGLPRKDTCSDHLPLMFRLKRE